MDRIDRETLTKMLQFVGERQETLETTPELLEAWLYNETFARWPENSSIARYDSWEPDSVNPTYRVSMGMELLQFSPDGEPELFKDLILFEMLQLSESPNRTKVTGMHRDFLEVANVFNNLWSKMLREFVTLAEKGTSKKRGPNIDTPEKVAKARLIMELKHRGQTVACNLASVAPATFRKWRNHPKVLHKMEKLRRDREFLEEIRAI